MTLTDMDEPGAGFETEEASSRSGAGLLERYADLRREITRLEAQACALLGQIDAGDAAAAAGALSTTAWLIHVTGEPPSVAASRVQAARSLRNMPETRALFQQGALCESRVRLLVAAYGTSPELYRRDEQVLVEQARSLPSRDFPKAVARWRQAADAEVCAADAEAAYKRRGLFLTSTWGGTGYLKGRYDPESLEVIDTAIKTLADPAGRDAADRRSPAQRRADALVEICDHFLDSGAAPRVGGEKPHLVVTVDVEALEGRAGGRCELAHHGSITPEAARRIACDAGVSRIIMRGPSEIIDVGRKTRVVSPALRRALIARDGGCTHPGCSRPPAWCDAHHIIPWADGGPTSLDNLELLCRPHHRMKHRQAPHPSRERGTRRRRRNPPRKERIVAAQGTNPSRRGARPGGAEGI